MSQRDSLSRATSRPSFTPMETKPKRRLTRTQTDIDLVAKKSMPVISFKVKQKSPVDIGPQPSLVPPYLQSQLEMKRENEKRKAMIAKQSLKNFQSAFDLLPCEQLDIMGRVRGKGTRLQANGQVKIWDNDRLRPNAYGRGDFFKVETQEMRTGTPLRMAARKADPKRPMFDSSGYVMSNYPDHHYFIDARREAATAYSEPATTKGTRTPLISSRPPPPQPAQPVQLYSNPWKAGEDSLAKLRLSRKYWQRTSWPAYQYDERHRKKKSSTITL